MNKENNPCIIIGWPTIARLAHGHTVKLEGVILIPDDLLSNTASQVLRGEFGACECTDPRDVICNGHRCGDCGQMIKPSDVKSHDGVVEAVGGDIPGGWKIGDRCYFSHPEKCGLLGCRVIGVIMNYEKDTNMISIEYNGRIFKQEHSLKIGGISGVNPHDVLTKEK